MYDSDDSFASDSDGGFEDFEQCCAGGVCPMRGGGGADLPFDPEAIQNIILNLSDQFDLRVVMSEGRVGAAALITGGLALAGSVVGKHYGGNLGAVFGGVVGGACGVGIAVVSLRDIWEDVKNRLWELYELAYDYLSGLGLRDYQAAASLLGKGGGQGAQLALILAEVASGLLNKKITTSIMPQ